MISSQRLSLKVIATSSFEFPSKPTANLKYYSQRVTRIRIRMHTSSLKPCDVRDRGWYRRILQQPKFFRKGGDVNEGRELPNSSDMFARGKTKFSPRILFIACFIADMHWVLYHCFLVKSLKCCASREPN